MWSGGLIWKQQILRSPSSVTLIAIDWLLQCIYPDPDPECRDHVIGHVRVSLGVFCRKSFNVKHCTQIFQPKSFMPAMHIDDIGTILWFYTTFSGCGLSRVTKSAESETGWIYFLACLSTNQSGIWLFCNNFKLNWTVHSFCLARLIFSGESLTDDSVQNKI